MRVCLTLRVRRCVPVCARVFPVLPIVYIPTLAVVGASMGGMISQEIALLDLGRVASLTLIVTHIGAFNVLLRPLPLCQAMAMACCLVHLHGTRLAAAFIIIHCRTHTPHPHATVCNVQLFATRRRPSAWLTIASPWHRAPCLVRVGCSGGFGTSTPFSGVSGMVSNMFQKDPEKKLDKCKLLCVWHVLCTRCYVFGIWCVYAAVCLICGVCLACSVCLVCGVFLASGVCTLLCVWHVVCVRFLSLSFSLSMCVCACVCACMCLQFGLYLVSVLY